MTVQESETSLADVASQVVERESEWIEKLKEDASEAIALAAVRVTEICDSEGMTRRKDGQYAALRQNGENPVYSESVLFDQTTETFIYTTGVFIDGQTPPAHTLDLAFGKDGDPAVKKVGLYAHRIGIDHEKVRNRPNSVLASVTKDEITGDSNMLRVALDQFLERQQ